MKITIEPTENYGNEIALHNPKVEVWIPGDEHTLHEVIEHILTPALRAFGYKVDNGQITARHHEA